MRENETKTKFFLIIILLFSFFILSSRTFATDYSSTSFTVKNPVLDSGLLSSSSTNFGLGQSLSQFAIGKSTSSSFQLWSGFQYFYKATANTLSATAGNGQVALNWTVPQTFLGATVAGYEVGTGTTSGSYVFESVGNVTNFTKTGLTNGTTYFFIIKALAPGGTFLVFSNQVSAQPTGPTPPPPPPPPSGGGGGGGPAVPPPPPPTTGNAAIVLSGLAYPGRSVSILRDGVLAANTIADPGAAFNVTLGGLGAGTYNISLYATDVNGKESPRITFAQTLTDSVTITVNNLFLGPTIGVSHEVIKKGENISIFGYTVPSSDVSIVVHSDPEFVENVKSNSSGAYFKAFGTSVLELGDHITKSQSAAQSLVSPFSLEAGFKVGDESVENQDDDCRRSDLNCDGKVNLTDFSILLFYWNQENPGNPRANINKLGAVDLTDFSILLYDWTG